jgi:hypothetical protein
MAFQKLGKKIRKGREIVRQGLDLSGRDNPTDPDLLPEGSVHIAAEGEIVGQNQVGKAVPVAEDLFRFFDVVKRNPEILGFHVSEGNVFSGNNEIRGSTFNPARLICSLDAELKRFQEGLQSGTIGVFRCLSSAQFRLNLSEVFSKHLHGSPFESMLEIIFSDGKQNMETLRHHRGKEDSIIIEAGSLFPIRGWTFGGP